jgi:hypothetical protein
LEFLHLVKLLFTMFPCKFQSGTDSSYEMLRFVEVISKHYSVVTTEPAINRSVDVRLLCFVFGLLDLQTTFILF